MSSPSCVSHDDSTSICAADASLDMSATRYGAKALDMPCGAIRKKGAIDSRCRRQHIDCSQREQISSLSAAKTYRVAKQHIDIPKVLISSSPTANISTHRRCCVSTKRKDFYQMNDNKNQLREDAIEFAIQISDLCDEIKGCSVYVNQIVRSSSSIGANIHEAKYAQSKADFVNKLEISLKECSETEYWLELIFRKGKMAEATYKDLRNKCGSIRRRLISSITTAKENA